MEKEEILAKSRKENKNKDIAELEVVNRSGRIAAIVGAVLCCVISFLDWHFTKTINCACWAVDFGMLTAMFVAKYVKLKKKHELIVAIVYFLIFAFFCYGYIFNLVRAA